MTPDIATALALVAVDGTARIRLRELRDAQGDTAALAWLQRLDALVAPLIAAQDAPGLLAVAADLVREDGAL